MAGRHTFMFYMFRADPHTGGLAGASVHANVARGYHMTCVSLDCVWAGKIHLVS